MMADGEAAMMDNDERAHADGITPHTGGGNAQYAEAGGAGDEFNAGGGAEPDGAGRVQSMMELGSAPAQHSALSAVRSDGVAPIVSLFCSSAVVMVAAARHCDAPDPDTTAGGACSSYEAYAVACGTVSAVASAALLAAKHYGRLEAVRLPASVFLLLWWIAGAGVMTFERPFHTTGSLSNGYFASWTAALSAYLLALHSVPVVRWLRERQRGLMNLPNDDALSHSATEVSVALAASVVLLVQASVDCSDAGDGCGAKLHWAIACSVVSVVACAVALLAAGYRARDLALRRVRLPITGHAQIFAVMFLVWWTFGWGVLTFAGPYTTPHNGFFACWAGFGCAVKILANDIGIARAPAQPAQGQQIV